jgi:hypothetical protein
MTAREFNLYISDKIFLTSCSDEVCERVNEADIQISKQKMIKAIDETRINNFLYF